MPGSLKISNSLGLVRYSLLLVLGLLFGFYAVENDQQASIHPIELVQDVRQETENSAYKLAFTNYGIGTIVPGITFLKSTIIDRLQTHELNTKVDFVVNVAQILCVETPRFMMTPPRFTEDLVKNPQPHSRG